MGSNCCLGRLSQKKSWLAGLSGFLIHIHRYANLHPTASESMQTAEHQQLPTRLKHCCPSCCDATFIHYFNHMIC